MTAFAAFKVTQDAIAIAGAILENGAEINSRTASASVNKGRLVCPSTGGKLKHPTSAAEVAAAIGVTPYRPEKTPYSSTVDWAANETVPFLERGSLMGLSEEAFADGDPVYARHTAKGDNTALGAFRNDADRDTAVPALLTVTDATDPVDDGLYAVDFHLEINGVAGGQLTAAFTTSTTTQANLLLGLKAAFEAQADVTATVATTETLSIAVDGTTDVLAAVKIDGIRVPSTNTTVVRTTQGSEAPTCALVPNLKVRKATSAAGVVPLLVTFA
jgi:hypothetical protein